MTEKKTYTDAMIRADAWQNQVTGQNTACDKSRAAMPIKMPIEEEQLGLFYQVDDVAQRVVDRIVDDALRHGFDLRPHNTSFYDYFWEHWSQLGLDSAFEEAWKWGRLFGSAMIILNIDDGQDHSMPLDMNRIRSIRYAKVLDRTDYNVKAIGQNPWSKYWRKPEVYQIFATTPGRTAPTAEKVKNQEILFDVHASRCIEFHGRLLPWHQFQDNDYFHESVLQPVWKPQLNYDAANEAIAKLMPEIRQMQIKIPGLIELVAAGELKNLQNRLHEMDRMRSVHRAVVHDAEEEITNSVLQLGGVENVLRKLAERVVQASNMPHTIVLGEGSEGNTSGRSENADWNSTVTAAQESVLLPRIKHVMDLFSAVQGAPKDLDDEKNEIVHEIRFNPLSQPTEKEKAETYKLTAEADNIYFTMGVLTEQEIMESRFTEEGFKQEVFLNQERLEEMAQAEADLMNAARQANNDADDADTFIPPSNVASAAAKGLAMRRQFGRGGTAVGIARARDLSNQQGVSLETIGRMVSFFARHEENKNSETENGEPGNGKIAWLLWGGDPGKKWAEEIWERSQKRDDAMQIQTIIFSKERFSREQVQEWIEENGFRMLKEIDETEESYRVRQIEPERVRNMRTISLAPGVQAVVGEPVQEG